MRNKFPSSTTLVDKLLALNINHINMDCFILVLDHFSLQQLIQLRTVCRWWNYVITCMLSSKRSIKLFGSIDDVYLYCTEVIKLNLHHDHKEHFALRAVAQRDDDIVCGDVRALTLLPRLFPNLERLMVCNHQQQWQLNMPNVLAQMPALQALTLFGVFHFGQLPQDFWPAINHLKSLEELHLFKITRGGDISKMLQSLSKVKKVTIANYDGFVDSCLDLLGPNIQELRLDNVVLSTKQLSDCLVANPGIAANLTHLTIGNFVGAGKMCYQKLFRMIGTRFKKLTHLDVLTYTEVRLVDLLKELSNLPVLTVLSLNIDANPKSNLEELNKSPVLVNIKRLFLKDNKSLKAVEFCRYFPLIFPFVEHIQLESASEQFLDEVMIAFNVKRLFSRLSKFKIIFPESCDHRNEPSMFSLAGRHYTKFKQYVNQKQTQSWSVAEQFVIMNEVYEEGLGDDEEMIRAVLWYDGN